MTFSLRFSEVVSGARKGDGKNSPSFGAVFGFDGNSGILLLPSGMDGILNQIDEDLTELVVIAEDFTGIGDIDQKLDGAQFVWRFR